MKRVVRIGIIGQSERLFEVISDYAREVAYKLGLLIAREGWILFSGGRDGIMEEASRGAKDGKGVTVGILPGINIEEANKYIDVHVTTGLGMDMRSDLMIHSVDAVIMVGGKNGTLKELTTAYMNNKPIVIMKRTGGFADIVSNILYEGRFLDSRRNVEIRFAETPEEAVEIIKQELLLK